MKEHQIWVVEEKGAKKVFYAAFTLKRWQWAKKLQAWLLDNGAIKVEIRTVEATPDKVGVS